MEFLAFGDIPEDNRSRPRGEPFSIGNGQDRTVRRENSFWLSTRESTNIADDFASDRIHQFNPVVALWGDEVFEIGSYGLRRMRIPDPRIRFRNIDLSRFPARPRFPLAYRAIRADRQQTPAIRKKANSSDSFLVPSFWCE